MGITLTPESAAVVAEAAADEEIESDRVEALVAEAAIAETLPEITPLADWEQALLDGDVTDSALVARNAETGEETPIATVHRETLYYGEDDSIDSPSTPTTDEETPEAETVALGFDRPIVAVNGFYRHYTEDEARAADAEVDELVARLNSGNAFTAPTAPTPLEGADLTSETFTQMTTEVAISRAILENRRYTLETYVGSSILGVPEGFSSNNGATGALVFHNPVTGTNHFVAGVDTANIYALGGGNEWRVSGYHSSPVFNVTPGTYSHSRTTISAEEHARVREAYGATADGQRVRTTVDSNATRTRAYAPGVLTESGRAVMRDQTTQWAGVRDVRRILAEDGGTISSPLSWTGVAGHTFIDQHGYAVEGGPFQVGGTLAITNDGGTLRTTSGAHELRCSCDRYRRTYHCSHVDYVRNNAPRMATKMNARPNRAANGENTGPYPVTLMNRSGFTHRTNEDGTNVGVFSDISSWGNMNRRAGEEFRISEVMRPDEVGSEGNVSVEQSMRAYQALNSGVRMSRSTPVLSALRRGTVEMSVSSAHMYDIDETSNPSVTGSVVISRDEAGTIAVGQGTLRCTCGRFASAAQAGSGTCPHVNLVADSVGRRLTAAALRDPDEQQFASNESVNVASEAQHAERMIRQEMASVRQRYLNAGEVLSEEDVRARATERIAAREAEREADRVRAEARREQQRAQEAERQRVEAMSYEERAVHSRQRHVQERADYLAANPEFATNLVAYRAAREAAWSEAEEGYGDNIAQARADADAAIAAKNAGEAFLTPLTENVTDGICDPNVPGSRKFGVELEFDIKSGVDHETAIRNIVRELREAGLTDQQRIGGYHSGRSSGWSQWNLEQDCTVSGELVSPLMSDTPEDWAKMKTALDILNRNGAKASVRTGSHVHVSTGSYVGSIAKHTELIRTVQDHQDVIYRAAADPKRGTHRGTQWCGPNRSTPPVSVNADDPSGLINGIDHYAHNGHGYMMNLEGTTSMNTKAHAEFRMWDATLDLATIQQQVATSAALADYADRTVENSGQSVGRERPTTIDGVVHGGRSISDDAMKNATELADKIFRRQSDRKRFVSLFGVNKWA
jgi:hypothetical protein